MRSGDHKSMVWRYFEALENEDKVMCKICEKKLSRTNSSTGNMLRHIIRQHHIPMENSAFSKDPTPKRKHKPSRMHIENISEFANSLQVGKETTIVHMAESKMSLDSSSKAHGNLNLQNDNELNGKIVSDLLLDVVVGDANDFSMLQGKYFKLFIENILFGFEVPDNSFFVEKMLQNCEQLQAEIQDILRYVDAASLVADFWKFDNGQSYISLTIHFVSSFSFTNESYFLALKKVNANDSVDHVTLWVKGVLTKFNITSNQITGICPTSDKDGLLGNACKEISKSFDWYYHECPILILQVLIQKSLDNNAEVKALLNDTRKVILLVNNSELILEQLENKKKQFPVRSSSDNDVKLELDLPGKWSTTLNMIEIFLKFQWPLTMLLKDSLATENINFDEANWSMMNLLKDSLQPLKVAQDILSGQKHTALSTLQPVVMGVIKKLKSNLTNTANTDIQLFCEDVIDQLQNKFRYEKLQVSNSLKATFLDPRYKTATMTSEISEVIIAAIKSELANENPSQNNFSQLNAFNSQEQLLNLSFQSSPLAVSTDEVVTMSLVSFKDSEVSEYLSMSKLPLNSDPLHFWKENSEQMVGLAILARRYLCIPASSKSTIKHRNVSPDKLKIQLNSEHGNELYFLYSNRYQTA